MTVKTRQQLIADSNALFTANGVGAITGPLQNIFENNLVESVAFQPLWTPETDSNFSIPNVNSNCVLTVVFTASRTATLPSAANTEAGTVARIIDNVGAISTLNTLTIVADGTDTIKNYNGSATSVTINQQYSTVQLISNGANSWNLTQSVGGSGASIFVDTVAILRNTSLALYENATTNGYYAPGDNGGTPFYGVTGASPGTYVDNGGSIIVPTGGDGSAAWIAIEPPLRALQWGLKGDGVTDDSTRAQAFVNANKGARCVFDAGKRFLIGGLSLVGSTYNNTQLIFNGTLLLKGRVNAGDVNFQSLVFVGIGVQQANNVYIDGYFDGNLANQYAIEQTFVICLAGVTNFKSNFLSFKELSADGVYITTALITTNSANSNGLFFASVIGENSVDAGRNLISLISGDNCTFGEIASRKVGGVINGNVMPGGFDAEADLAYQSIKNLVIGSANIVTAGTSGFTLYSQAGSNGLRDANVGVVSVINTALPNTNDEFGNLTLTTCQTLLIRNVSNVRVASFNGEFLNAYGTGVNIGTGDRVFVNASVQHVQYGALIANEPTDIPGLTNSVINVDVRDVARFGFFCGNVSSSVIAGRAYDPKTAYFSARYGVIASGSWTQGNVTYSVMCLYEANWTQAYRNDGVTFAETRILNAVFGPSWPSYIAMVNMPVAVYSSPGYTDTGLGVPSTGPHVKGQYIKNANPVVGQPKGWYCTVAGTPGTWVSEGNL